MTGRMYYCQIYDNGKKIRDYIPCVSPEGDFGLYDAVTKAFFKNASGGVGFRGKVVLPQEYTWLEYIYSGGNAYIDTGFKPNQSTRVVMDAQLVNANDVSKTICFFGVRGNNTYYEIYKASTGNWKLTYLYGTNTNQAFTIDYSTRHYIDYNKNTATIDWGTSLTYTAQTFQMIYNLFLGADNGSGSATAMAPMRIFHSAIWDNGEIIRLFVPCINKSGVYGLYDRVNDKFYSSAGAGQFGEEPVVYDFAYTGGEQTVPLKPGTYKLECWGAQGGVTVGMASVAGGAGGYAVGVFSLANTANIYINVGGKGTNGTISSGYNATAPPAGGYNGGGAGGSRDDNVYVRYQTGAGGGGATHIGKSSGLLSAITDSDLLIAAGGGGGASGGTYTTPFEEASTEMIDNGSSGGAGGGESGILGNLGRGSTSGYQYGGYGGGGGTSTSGGYGGTKGDYNDEDADDAIYSGGGGGGGGGGYYGGGGGAGGRASYGDECKNGTYGSKGKGGDGGDPGINGGWWAGGGGGGGGGSAFAASSLTSVSLIAGNATMPSITGGTETGHAGNGYARITKIA